MSKINLYRTEINTCAGAGQSDETRFSEYLFTTALQRGAEKKVEKYTKPIKSGVSETGVCTDGSCGENLDPILDPRFNLRETAKDMILLEDHLTQPKRRCKDCIKKHSLKILGWLEEGESLDKKGEYKELFENTLFKFKEAINEILRKIDDGTIVENDYTIASQKLREIRKPLCIKFASFC